MKIPEYIIIKNKLGKSVAFLNPETDKLKGDEVDTQLNGQSTLTFSIPVTSKKLKEITPECKIYPGNGREYCLFADENIDYIRDEKGILWAKITAYESFKLLETEYATVRNDSPNPPSHLHTVIILSGGSDLSGGRFAIGSAGHALYGLLAKNEWNGKTPWTVGTVDVTGIHDLETEKDSLFANIKKIQDLWGGYLVFDSVNKIISLRNEDTWQNFLGFQIRYGKNLKNMTRTQTNRIVSRLYAYGKDDLNFASVNGGKEYIDNNSFTSTIYKDIVTNNDISNQSELLSWAQKELAKKCKPQYNYKGKFLDLRTLPEYSHEEFKLGDIIDIVDSGLGVNEKQRIIRHKYKVFQPWDCEVELGIPSLKLAVTISENNKATEKVNNMTNNRGQVVGSYLADAAVTTRALANLSVDVSKLAELSITASKIANGSIIMPKLGDAAVGASKIADYAVNGTKIANAAIGAAHIVNGAIVNSHLVNACIDSAKIADAAITSAKIGNAAVGSAAIASAAIGTAHIATAAILTAHIADAQVTNAKIVSLSADKITAGTIIATVSLTSPVIYGGYIYGSYINIGSGRFTVDSNGYLSAQGATIQGSIQTASSGARIVLGSNNTIASYNSSNQLHGLYSAPDSWADIFIYRKGVEMFRIYDNGTVVNLYAFGTSFLYSSGANTYGQGTWTFSGALYYGGYEVATRNYVTSQGYLSSSTANSLYSPINHSHNDYALTSHTHSQYVQAQSFGGYIEFYTNNFTNYLGRCLTA